MPHAQVLPAPLARRAGTLSSAVDSNQPATRPPVAQTRPPLAQTHSPGRPPTAASTLSTSGPTPLFEVPFASAMSDRDVALLARTLDLTTHMHPKLRQSPTSPGAVRLDHDSGLLLKRGAVEGRWVLEARTWGRPPPETIREWHVLAAGAARLLDPIVALPERLAAVSPEYPMHPPGRAANKRLARIGRRLSGL